jgi:hypothetical protein
MEAETVPDHDEEGHGGALESVDLDMIGETPAQTVSVADDAIIETADKCLHDDDGDEPMSMPLVSEADDALPQLKDAMSTTKPKRRRESENGSVGWQRDLCFSIN